MNPNDPTDAQPAEPAEPVQDLHALLADGEQAGAYFVADSDTAAMAEAGAALGFAVVRIDLAGCADKDAVLACFARALRFPEWFGGNWDALADALADLSWLPAPGYLLLIEHPASFGEAAGDEFEVLLEILNESALRWADHGSAMWSLLPTPVQAA